MLLHNNKALNSISDSRQVILERAVSIHLFGPFPGPRFQAVTIWNGSKRGSAVWNSEYFGAHNNGDR